MCNTEVVILDKNLREHIKKILLGKTPDERITRGDMANLPESRLVVPGNGIKNLTGLEYATTLRWLDLSHNPISDITPVAGLTNLTELEIEGTSVSNISPLAGLTNLTVLSLSKNCISDISPLVGLTNLRRLFLSENRILDLDISPLAELTNLTVLVLSGNSISDISPLVDNQGLDHKAKIFLRDNPLNAESKDVHIHRLRERGVYVEF